MSVFLFILLNNILPIFIIIGLGYLLARKFSIDIYSLSKLNFYLFVPALVFVKVYETNIESNLFLALLYGICFLIILSGIASLIARLANWDISLTNAFKNSIMFYNSGNFGLPLIMLTFANTPYASYAVSIQIMILMVQNLTTNTLGFYHAGRSSMGFQETIQKIMRMPSTYAIALAIICKLLPYNLSEAFFWPSISYLKNALVPVALLALGTQLARTTFNIKDMKIYLASFLRLILGPIIAFVLLKIMGIDGVMAKVLFISSSVPTAVNTALIAVEFDNQADFVSQVVLVTTLFSALTLSVIIYLTAYLF